MLKTIAYLLLGIVVIAIIAGLIGINKFNNNWFKDRPNYLTVSSETKPMTFVWNADSLEPHVAMSIPAKLDGMPFDLQFQFDTGSAFSFIYSKTLESLGEQGLAYKIVEKDGKRYVNQIECVLGGNRTILSMIQIYENYGNLVDGNDTLATRKIGTIGADILDKRITMIDFKNKFIQFFDIRPDWMSSIENFSPFSFKGRRLMLPVKMGQKESELYYDTGCSSFGLITSKYRFDKLTDRDSSFIKLEGNRFGESIPIVHKNSIHKMEIGGANLEVKRISYVDMYASFQRFVSPFTRIGGWLGNKPFLESRIIIDAKTEEFAISKSDTFVHSETE